MNRIKLELTQQTPLIHFQPDQDGATLRATELKPKLDKFLNQQVFKARQINENTSFVRKWGDKDQVAFDYKIKIKITGEIKIDEIHSRFPLFFGNMGSESQADLKKFSFVKGKVEITILTIHRELKEAILAQIQAFFFLHNFGTRQSKGFGSFLVTSLNSKTMEISEYKNDQLPYNFSLNIDQGKLYGRDGKFNQLFEKIDLFYNTLRGGINAYGKGHVHQYYFKSLIFLYAKKELGLQWEKKEIKTKLIQQKGNASNENTYLIKELMGLSTEEVWRSSNRNIHDRIIVKEYKNTSNENDKIERFPSPLFFKPIKVKTGFKIYFGVLDVGKSLLQNFLEKEFEISVKLKKKDREREWEYQQAQKKIKKSSICLNTPPIDQNFDFDRFLNFAFQIDLNKHVEHEFHRDFRHRNLKSIYSQLKKQVKV